MTEITGKPGVLQSVWSQRILKDLVTEQQQQSGQPSKCVLVKLLQSCPTAWDPVDCSPPDSSVHGFSRQEYWSGLPCPPPGDLPDPGIKPASIIPPTLAGRFFIARTTWEAPVQQEDRTILSMYWITKSNKEAFLHMKYKLMKIKGIDQLKIKVEDFKLLS